MEVKETLISRGVWSQYLEVGIGPDAEIFTKCQPMASVGYGADVGMHPMSSGTTRSRKWRWWSTARAAIVGATLGNDVNLRDVEGRSALLLGKAKDNNASASLGPFIRLFDGKLHHRDVKQARYRASTSKARTGSCSTASTRWPDLALAGGARRGHDRPAPPVSRRPRALSRHDVRAGEGSRRRRARALPTSSATSLPISTPSLGTLTNSVQLSPRLPALDLWREPSAARPGHGQLL